MNKIIIILLAVSIIVNIFLVYKIFQLKKNNLSIQKRAIEKVLEINKLVDNQLNAISKSNFDTLLNSIRGKKIYFGHQSVGYNLINGVARILKLKRFENYKIIEGYQSENNEDFVLIHNRVGKNRDYISKINDFSDQVRNKISNDTDFVGMKLCYVDIIPDYEKIFSEYKRVINKLEQDKNNPVIIHFTMPLKSEENEKNSFRTKYNELIRKEYGSTGILFDIARLESLAINGGEVVFQQGDQNYPKLFDQFTFDYGHLNELGQIVIAKEFLKFIANLKQS